MPNISIRPSQRPDKYPNGGDESYWMGQVAGELEKRLQAWGIHCLPDREDGTLPENCGLFLYLGSHAAPEEIEARIKGTEIHYYEYSPAGKRAAEIFARYIKSVYPQPDLVEVSHTAAREELSAAQAPALLIKLGYHDNPQDEAWLVNNIDTIADRLAAAAADFLGVEL